MDEEKVGATTHNDNASSAARRRPFWLLSATGTDAF